MRFVGLDLHKHSMEVCALDDRGKCLFRDSVDCERNALEQFAREKLGRDDRLALEATTNTWAVVEILRPFVAEVVVGNPLQIKAIAQAKVKTDKIDSQVLAQLLRCDFLPTVWQPDQATQRLRQLAAVRAGLVGDRTRIKNRVHSVLAELLVVPPYKVLFTKQGLTSLRSVTLPEQARRLIDAYSRVHESVQQELDQLEGQMLVLADGDERARLLMTLPGVAHGVALSLLAALGDLSRFKDGDHAASYLGLVPSTRQSGRNCRHGPITKAGCALTRSMLIQAAQHAAAHAGPVGAFFRRLRKKKSRSVAIVATARKLVTIAFLMLKNNEPYRYARPETVKAKLSEARRKAGRKAAASAGDDPPARRAERGLPQGGPAGGEHPRAAARRGAARARRCRGGRLRAGRPPPAREGQDGPARGGETSGAGRAEARASEVRRVIAGAARIERAVCVWLSFTYQPPRRERPEGGCGGGGGSPGGSAPRPPEFSASAADARVRRRKTRPPVKGAGLAYSRPPGARVALPQSPLLPTARGAIAPTPADVQPKFFLATT
jgi:transposase